MPTADEFLASPKISADDFLKSVSRETPRLPPSPLPLVGYNPLDGLGAIGDFLSNKVRDERAHDEEYYKTLSAGTERENVKRRLQISGVAEAVIAGALKFPRDMVSSIVAGEGGEQLSGMKDALLSVPYGISEDIADLAKNLGMDEANAERLVNYTLLPGIGDVAARFATDKKLKKTTQERFEQDPASPFVDAATLAGLVTGGMGLVRGVKGLAKKGVPPLESAPSAPDIDIPIKSVTERPSLKNGIINFVSDVPVMAGKAEKSVRGLVQKIVDKVPESLRQRVVPPDLAIKSEQGVQILRGIDDAQKTGETYTNRWSVRLKDVLGKNTGATRELVEGGKAPAIGKFLEDFRNWFSKTSGKELGRTQNYFPRVLKQGVYDAFQNDAPIIQSIIDGATDATSKSNKVIAEKLGKASDFMRQAAEHLVKNKQARNLYTAIKKIQADNSKVFGRISESSFEKPRTLNYPSDFFETDVPKALNSYVVSMSKRVAQAEKFGKEGEFIEQAFETLKKQAPSEFDAVDRIFDIYTGRFQRLNQSAFNKAANENLSNMAVAGKIGTGLSTVANSFQTFISSVPEVGIVRSMKGVAKAFTQKQAGDIAKLSTGSLDEYRDIVGASRHGKLGKLADFTLDKSGFNATNYMNNFIASAQYSEFFRDLHKIADGDGVRANWAQKALADHGIDYTKPLTDDVLIRAATGASRDSQLHQNYLKQPEILNNPRWRWFFALKRFSINQTAHTARLVTREISRGNAMPFLRLAAAGVLGGEVAIWATNQIKEAVDGKPHYRKEDAMWERLVNDVAALGTMGMFTDITGTTDIEKLPDKLMRLALPVSAADLIKAAEVSKRFASESEDYGTDIAFKRNVDELLAVPLGGVGKGVIDRAFNTKGEQKAEEIALRSKELGELRDLILDKNSDAVRDRLKNWNESHPKLPITTKDISTKELMNKVKRDVKKKQAADPMVKVSAVQEDTGETIELTMTASEALAEVRERTKKYNDLLEYVRS